MRNITKWVLTLQDHEIICVDCEVTYLEVDVELVGLAALKLGTCEALDEKWLCTLEQNCDRTWLSFTYSCVKMLRVKLALETLLLAVLELLLLLVVFLKIRSISLDRNRHRRSQKEWRIDALASSSLSLIPLSLLLSDDLSRSWYLCCSYLTLNSSWVTASLFLSIIFSNVKMCKEWVKRVSKKASKLSQKPLRKEDAEVVDVDGFLVAWRGYYYYHQLQTRTKTNEKAIR